MTTAPGGLSITNHSPSSQCRSSTFSRILYLALKAAIPLGVSTNLENLPILSCRGKSVQKKKKKGRKGKFSLNVG